MGLNLAVVGIGRLGLCFALNLEKVGYNVIGYDIRDDHIYEVNGKLLRSSEPGLNDLIKNYSFKVGGYNFLEPRFYFSRKNKKTERDLKDWDGIKKFFQMESHKGFPFNNLDSEQMGEKYCE